MERNASSRLLFQEKGAGAPEKGRGRLHSEAIRIDPGESGWTAIIYRFSGKEVKAGGLMKW